LSVDLSIEVTGITFSNPIIVSSGDITRELRIVKNLIKRRPGGITLKTASLSKGEFYVASPGFLDKYGEPGSSMNYSPGLDYLSPLELKNLVREVLPLSRDHEVVLIGSVGGSLQNVEEWIKMADFVNSLELEAIELDIWIPLGRERILEEQLELEREALGQIISEVKRVISKPLSVKTAENYYFTLKSHAETIRKLKPNIWHVQGQFPTPVVDIDRGELLFPPQGGWGRNQRGIGVYVTLMASTLVDLPLISSGGIYNSRTAIERLMVGASLAGIYSEIVYRGYDVIPELVGGLRSFLEQRGYSSVKEIVGKAKHCATPEWIDAWFMKHLVPREQVKIWIEEDKCIGCGKCATCVYEAIYMDKAKQRAVLIPELCIRCGRCASICPTNAIKIVLPS